jgi:large subunit ribosomal protein L1
MDDKNLKEALAKAKESKRNFKQTFDLIINLKDLDLKKPEHQIDFFATLHNNKGKKVKVCGLVGPEMVNESKRVLDFYVVIDDFEKYEKEKKIAKKLASQFDYFVGQANIMPKIATAFGKTLGRRGKMPNPKAGCIVPSNANLESLYNKLQKTVKLSAKKDLVIQCAIGTEDMKDEEIIDNIKTIYDQLIHHLPNEQNNVKNIFVKLTMGKPVKLAL